MNEMLSSNHIYNDCLNVLNIFYDVFISTKLYVFKFCVFHTIVVLFNNNLIERTELI